MKTQFSKLALIAMPLIVVGCASGPAKNTKTSKEAEVYLKGVRSQVVQTKGKATTCKVESQIQEKNWVELVKKANACVEEKQFSQVERYGDHLAKEHHMGPWGPYFLSLSAEAKGDLDRAMWMIELALKKAPQEGLLIYQKGRLQHARGEMTAAVQSFEDSIKIRSDLLGARMVLGQIYYRDQDFDKAKVHFKSAVELDSQMTEAWAALAECELEDGNGEAALVALEKAINLDNKNLDHRIREAYIYEKVLNKPEQALDSYQKAQVMGQKTKVSQNVTDMLNEKVKQLREQIAKAKPGEQVSQRTPAKEGVSK